MTILHFTKMNGCKNEFILFDARKQEVTLTPDHIRKIAHKTEGLDADQVILFNSSSVPGIDAEMTIFNADGSEAEACGNATRCVAHLLNTNHTPQELMLKTKGGLLKCTFPTKDLITVDMGCPKWNWDEIPLASPKDPLNITLNDYELPSGSVVNVGNPHLVFFVDDLKDIDHEGLGRALEIHPLFPQRINVSFAKIISNNTINLKVWERGVGHTQACGSAACATAVLAHKKGLCGPLVHIHQPGGMLIIQINADHHVLMTGPIEHEFAGEIEL